MEWDVETYELALTRAMASSGHTGTLEMMFGPLVRSPTQVSQHTLVRSLTLVETLVEMGQLDGVVHGARLQSAVGLVLHKQGHLLPPGDSAEALAHAFTDHVMAVLRMLRTIIKEESLPRRHRAFVHRPLQEKIVHVCIRSVEQISCIATSFSSVLESIAQHKGFGLS